MDSGSISRTALFLLFPLVLLTGACNHLQKKTKKLKNVTPFTNFKPGVVVDKVPCTSDTSESYALYLPSDYKSSQLFPVVFFFDAHKRGALVVKKYKIVAEKLGFILVASNNSENGQPAKVRERILYHFMQDVENRFSLDPQRIYTSGFSGGARVAAGIGLFNTSVSGTIGLEAGFPAIRQIPDNHLTWVGVVGNLDFNYLEMKYLENYLDKLGMKNLLIVYPGKHALPPAKIFERAYDFLDLTAMREKIIPINQALIDSVKLMYEKIRLNAVKKHQLLKQLETDQTLVKNLEGLTHLSFFKKEIKRLSTNKYVLIKKKRENTLMKTEAETQQRFNEAMNERDAAWWKHQIQIIYQKKKAARYEDEKLMNQRLLNYLSLTSYLYANGSIDHDQLEAAKKFLMMYQMVDPENDMVYFLKAEYYALKNQKEKALSSLQDAVNHGFKDAHRTETNAYFQKLKIYKKFNQLLKEMQRKSNAQD